MRKIHAMVSGLHNPDLGILFIRIALGLVFMHAGWLKVANAEFVVTSFAAIGIPAYLAYFVMYAELIGGALIILGFFARYIGIILAVIMIVAIVKAHLVNGFGLQNNGYEYVLVLLLNSLAIVTLGDGKYSLERLVKKG